MEHPFVKRAGRKKIIADLVEECMKEIDEYREQEAKEAEEKDGAGGDGTFGSEMATLDNGLGAEGGATLIKRGPGGSRARAEDEEPEEEYDDDEGGMGSGTLVINRKQVVAAPGAAPPAGGAAQAGQAPQAAAPPAQAPERKAGDAKADAKADAKEGKEGKSAPKQHPGVVKWPTSSGTLVQKGGAGGDMQYYRNGQSLDVDGQSSLLDLRMSLISLNKAYEDEMAALEAFYAKRRQQLKDLITKKEKEAEAAKGGAGAGAGAGAPAVVMGAVAAR
jgi:hypothetical protein